MQIRNYDRELVERFKALRKHHSVAQIARKTGTLISNVSRYAAGTRMPARFLCALAAELDVSPAWLLTGTGSPFSSEVTESTRRAAGDLLQLIEAMNAVARLKLGQLAGKPSHQLLRDLHDAVANHDLLAQKLNSQVAPVLQQLAQGMTDAVAVADRERGLHLQALGRQVARFCTDIDALRAFRRMDNVVEFHFGDPKHALELTRRMFFASLAPGEADEHRIALTANFTVLLTSQGQYADARLVASAMAKFLEGQEQFARQYRMFVSLEAQMNLHTGELRKALLALTNLSMDDTTDINVPSWLQLAFLLHGATTIQAALDVGPTTPLKGNLLLQFGLFTEDLDALRTIVERFQGLKGGAAASSRLMHHHAKLLLESRELGTAARSKTLAAHAAAVGPEGFVSDDIGPFFQAILRCQYARFAGARKAALVELRDAHSALHRLPKNALPPILFRALHFSNARALLAEQPRDVLREEAQRFFEWHVKRGYRAFGSKPATEQPH